MLHVAPTVLYGPKSIEISVFPVEFRKIVWCNDPFMYPGQTNLVKRGASSR